jgi:predicted Rossmann fold flavoprotein
VQDFDVIVIGAGAAGLFCAFTAGRRGRRVLVLERANRPGKKILMSGGGRCNFTNLHIDPGCFLSTNPSFCISALSRYTQRDFIALVEQHGIPYHEKKNGQLFCDNSSRDILDMLLRECTAAGVQISANCETYTVEGDNGFRLATSAGDFHAASLVVASGGLSIPRMGGSGWGYDLARQFGMDIIPTRAGLVPFTFSGSSGEFMARLAGVSVPVRVSTSGREFVDDLLFTHRGLSGPAALQLSSYWQEDTAITINLMPQFNVAEYLPDIKRLQPRQLLRSGLMEHLPRALVQSLESLWWPKQAGKPLAEWPDRTLAEIAHQIAHWTVLPAGTEGYRTAEVTVGGVDTRGLSSKNMESRNCAGLYFIGEVVDVTGWLGGFNFQWAWSSGYAAGQVV